MPWYCGHSPPGTVCPDWGRRLGDQPASAGQIAFVRDRITIAIEFLTWLRSRHQSLDTTVQTDIDDWLITGPSTRYGLRTFLEWAARNRHVQGVEIPSRRKTAHHTPALDADHRWELARNLLHNNEIGLTYRVAGLLVLLYAQPMTAIIELTVEQVTRSADGVFLSLGEIPSNYPNSWMYSSREWSITIKVTHRWPGSNDHPGCFPAHTPADTSATSGW